MSKITIWCVLFVRTNGFIIDRSFGDSMFRTYCAVGMILFQLYIFKTFFNHSNKVTKVLARASYAAYLVQGIFLGLLIMFAVPHLQWNPWWVILFVGAVSSIGSFITGIILCRLPILRKVF